MEIPWRRLPPSSSVNVISNLAACVVSLKLIPINTVEEPPPDDSIGIEVNSCKVIPKANCLPPIRISVRFEEPYV